MLKKFTAVLLITGLIFTQTAAFAEAAVMKRSQVPDKYKWDLTDIYKDSQAFEADFIKVRDQYIPQIQAFKGKLTNTEALLKCLRLRDELNKTMENLYVYAYMKADLDLADNEALELCSRTESLASQASAATAFISPELLAQPEVAIEGYLKDPSLRDYRQFLNSLLERKAHTLSSAEEELLALIGDFAGSPYSIFQALSIADTKYPEIVDDKGKKVQVSPGLYSQALDSKDREYRKRAHEGIYSPFEGNKNTYTALLEAQVKKNVFFAKARKYDSALEAALSQELIPVAVFDNLIKGVNDNLGFLHDYVSLRKKVLGLDRVHNYDMYVPLTKNYERKIPFEEAKELILAGLSPLGDEYLKDLKKAFNSRWIDVYETENKYTGGYQWGTYDSHPFVLLNYNDTPSSMLTLAHEMGHAMNSYYTNSAQKYINSETPVFTAEIASTANEIIILKYLIDNAKSDEEKLYYMCTLAENIRGAVYTQAMFSEFEKAIHERVENGEGLSAETLRGITRSLMSKYFGKDFVVDEFAEMWWARVPHFYDSFYVYQYATSMSAANEMVKAMSGPDAAAAKAKYLEFLKAGNSDYPIELIKAAGVDMMSTQPVENLLDEFGRLVAEMETIIDKQQQN